MNGLAKPYTNDKRRSFGAIARVFAMENVVLFIILFALYAFRSLSDLTSPYLWAEDGTILIQRAMDNGLGAFFLPGNGCYWFLQQLVASISYNVLLAFGNLALLPQMMSLIVKAATTLSILYFVSDRFEWVLKGKYARFFTCVFIVLLLPASSCDVTTCDTSMPFALFIAAFLIGLDLLCGPKAAMPNGWQTLFLTAFSLSFAGAVFIAAFCGLAALRWLIVHVQKKVLNAKCFAFQAVKLLIIFSAVLLQALTILNSDRSNADLDLWNRLIVVTRHFVIFPYPDPIWPQSIRSVLLGVFVWFLALKAARVPLKTVLYFGAFSYLMSFYCSLATSVENWQVLRFGAVRYFFVNYQIAAMLLCIVAVRLFRAGRFKRHIAALLTTAMAISSLSTYVMPVLGAGYAYFYKHYIGYFVPGGSDRMFIPTGPHRPWGFKLPVALSEKPVEEDLSIEVTGPSTYWNALVWQVSAQVADGRPIEQLWILHENVYYPSQEMEGGGFSVDTWHRVFKGGFTVDVVGKTADGVLHRTTYAITIDQLIELGVLEPNKGESTP